MAKYTFNQLAAGTRKRDRRKGANNMARSQENGAEIPQEGQKPASQALPFERIEAAVKSVKYGVVQLIIQDGRVVQIDKTEKIRLV